jgi:hypothetical protein
MTTGINGQKTCILRTDEKYDATWHHWAGKGLSSPQFGEKLEMGIEAENEPGKWLVVLNK